MGKRWTDSIVTFIDLVGVTEHAPSGAGSQLMRRLHDVIGRQMAEDRFGTIKRAYVWNDSVLFLAHAGASGHADELILRDADTLKREIDRAVDSLQRQLDIRRTDKSFAVAVKGLAIPPPAYPDTERNPRFVYIEASSYAFGNCLRIQKHFKKCGSLYPWYVDSRITGQIRALPRPVDKKRVRLLPKKKKRLVVRHVIIFG